MLESMLSQLSSQHIFQTKGILNSIEDKRNILARLNNSSMQVNVILGSTDVTVKDLYELKVGDVLRLDSKVNDDLLVKVNHLPKFIARPGTKNNKIAINITGDINESDFEQEQDEL
ncbi:MAG: FliM/FliN family flagellar motor switch protein [Ignavibacteriales bacterium]|nr:FliM/FliN family flagellar motor switch protein [Ignavibacteriales bacterium]